MKQWRPTGRAPTELAASLVTTESYSEGYSSLHAAAGVAYNFLSSDNSDSYLNEGDVGHLRPRCNMCTSSASIGSGEAWQDHPFCDYWTRWIGIISSRTGYRYSVQRLVKDPSEGLVH